MNKIIFLLLFIPYYSFADLYEEALKLDAKGEYKKSIETFKEYFNKNINRENQDSITQKLIYVSTMFNNVDESLDFLVYYVKFMTDSNSRFLIYKQIAQIYELNGNMLLAGKYFEKAAYTAEGELDYNTLLHSFDILVELGYFNETLEKISIIDQSKLNSVLLDRYNYIKSRAYFLSGYRESSIEALEKVVNKDSKYWFLYNQISDKAVIRDGYSESLDYLVSRYSFKKLRNPADYYGVNPSIGSFSSIPFKDNKTEIYLGDFKSKADGAGIINILNQLNLSWFFDEFSDGYSLYIFTENREKTERELFKLGIAVGEIDESNIR